MSGVSKTNHRLTRIHKVGDVFCVVVRQLAEPSKQNEQIGRHQRFQPRNMMRPVRVNDARLRIDGKQHRAVKAVPLRKNLRKHRHAFLGTVVFLTGHKHDVLSGARAGRSL
jgi:hypothetical protein